MSMKLIISSWYQIEEQLLSTTLEECHEPSEGASVNANRNSEKLGVQYGPTAAGRRAVLDPQFRRMRLAFTDVPEIDSWHLHCYYINWSPKKVRAAIGHFFKTYLHCYYQNRSLSSWYRHWAMLLPIQSWKIFSYQIGNSIGQCHYQFKSEQDWRPFSPSWRIRLLID